MNNQKELWDLINNKKEKTGIIHERGKESTIPNGMYHLVVDIWVKKPNGDILLTQRHPEKSYGLNEILVDTGNMGMVFGH